MAFGHGGARVGAGRKPFLENRTIEQICRMSAASIYKALKAPDSEFSLEKKAELAKHFVLKSMPQKLEGEGFQGNQIVHIVRNDRAVAEEKATPLLPR